MQFLYRSLLAISTILIFSNIIFAQTGSLKGTVTSAVNKEPIAGATIEITELHQTANTDENGVYEFKNIPPGNYTVVTHIEGFSDRTNKIQVGSGAATLDFSLSLKSINAQVTVTATGTEESVYDTFSSVNSVGTTRIAEKASTGIGEILENEAGVSKRSFGGGGTSRPSIRGFEGDRVLVLQDGVRNGSVGSQSGDHGEPVAALNLERLEIVKGPATLLYGSNAIGGVVNAVTDDEDNPHPGFHGYFTALGGTVNKQGGVAGGLEYGYKKFLSNTNLNFINEGDYDTPLGRVPNTNSRNYGGSQSFGYFADKGFVRGIFTVDRRRYGIPFASLFEDGTILSIANGGINCDNNPNCEYNIDAIKAAFADQLPPESDEQVDLRMRRNNYRIVGGFRNLNSPIEQGNFYLDYTNYVHEELEVEDGIDTVGTTFFNDTFSYRGLFQQRKYKNLSGKFGFDGYTRNYLTEGAEALVDGKVKQDNFAVFAFQDLDFERFSFQIGARLENNRYNTESSVLTDRSFTGVSVAGGVKFKVLNGGSLVANFNSSYRAPALEELYNFGAHIGTVTYEIGDQNLQRERSNGAELSYRQDAKRVRFNGSVYYYGIDNFVYLAPQDFDNNGFVDVEDNLPIGRYLQNDSRYIGADASLEVDFNNYIGAFVVGDIVNAKLKDSDLPLPRITPARVRIGLNLQKGGFSARPEVVFVSKKGANDIFPLETTTDGYALFNLNATYTIAYNKTAHIITFGGGNLTDKLYRNHSNFIKDLAPEAGRGIKLSYTVRFF